MTSSEIGATSRRIAGTVLAVWIGGGFTANYAWEMLQMPLYEGMGDGWLRCASAAAVDVAVLSFVYLVVAAAVAIATAPAGGQDDERRGPSREQRRIE